MKSIFKYLLIATALYTTLFFTINYFVPFNPGSITADSGWDSDYDSGGSDWGGSDYGGYDYDGGSYGGGSSYYFTDLDYVFLIIYIFVIGSSFVIVASKSPKVSNSNSSTDRYNTGSSTKYGDGPITFKLCSKEKLQEAGIKDVEKLKDTLYKVFVDVQMAWMDFDYDALANLCSNELYNSYKSDLEVLKLKNGKNVMSDFEIIKIGILEADKDEEKTTVQMVLEVSFHDYVINEITGKVIRGSKSRIMRNVYLLDYVKYHKTVSTCPSCGTKLKKNSNKKCDYCGCIVVNNNKNYVLTHKERI